MSGISFLICENSYIIRKGLLRVLEELGENVEIKEVDGIEGFRRHLDYFEPDFLIVNPQVFGTENFFYTDIPARLRKCAIGLYSCPDLPENPVFPEFIALNDTKSNILEKIKSLITRCKGENYSNTGSSPEITGREKLIVKYVALGLTNKEIADKLFISSHTVVTHRRNITRKLGIKTVSGLTVYAILNNIVNIEEINR